MSLPPGPSAPPLVQTLRWVARPGPFMESCARRYGHCFTVRLAQVGTLVFVSDPGALKQVFTADPGALRAGEANVALEPVLGSRSVLLLDGAEHMRQRRLMLPAFHGERLARYAELIEQITAEAVERWPAGRPFTLQPRTQAITLEIILRVVFGIEEGERLTNLRDLIKRTMDISTSSAVSMMPWLRRDLGRLSPFARFLKALAEMDAVLFDEIARRRADPALAERDDIFSMLVQARDEDGRPLTDGELRDELVTLLVAGHETTATALAWAFERMLRSPDVLERLTEEALAGDDDTYADAVVKETLRLRAPIPIVARHVREPFELLGHELPPGVMVAPCIYLVHRRPDLYPEPYAFRPERFLERPAETYGWIPFGGGIRRCLGASFAGFEMKIVLRAVVARVRLSAEDPDGERTRRRAIVLAPREGARAVLTERITAPRRPLVAS